MCVFHNDPRVNDRVSRLLDTPVAPLRYVSPSSDKCATLGAYIRGLVESKSFSSWALAFVFAILKELECPPGDDIFHHLVTSLTVLLASRVMAPSFATSFMKQYHCETFVSHLRLRLLLLRNMRR